MQGEEQRRLREENKRVRVDTPVLERELFRLFEMQPAWTFQQLQLETKQPTMHLKNVLEQVRKHFWSESSPAPRRHPVWWTLMHKFSMPFNQGVSKDLCRFCYFLPGELGVNFSSSA